MRNEISVAIEERSISVNCISFSNVAREGGKIDEQENWIVAFTSASRVRVRPSILYGKSLIVIVSP
jgi:hypothetical protein